MRPMRSVSSKNAMPRFSNWWRMLSTSESRNSNSRDEVGPIDLELPVDVVDGLQVVPQQREPAVNRRGGSSEPGEPRCRAG